MRVPATTTASTWTARCGASGDGSYVRADVSATLFLSDPGDYDGGVLTISDTFGHHGVKLAAGSLVVYPSSSLHEVTPVTRGERLACFMFIQSMVRDPLQRRELFDMDMALLELRQQVGETAPDRASSPASITTCCDAGQRTDGGRSAPSTPRHGQCGGLSRTGAGAAGSCGVGLPGMRQRRRADAAGQSTRVRPPRADAAPTRRCARWSHATRTLRPRVGTSTAARAVGVPAAVSSGRRSSPARWRRRRKAGSSS